MNLQEQLGYKIPRLRVLLKCVLRVVVHARPDNRLGTLKVRRQ